MNKLFLTDFLLKPKTVCLMNFFTVIKWIRGWILCCKWPMKGLLLTGRFKRLSSKKAHHSIKQTSVRHVFARLGGFFLALQHKPIHQSPCQSPCHHVSQAHSCWTFGLITRSSLKVSQNVKCSSSPTYGRKQ